MTLLDKVEVEIAAIIGEKRLTLCDVLRLRRGALIALDRPGVDHVTLAIGACAVGAAQLSRDANGGLRAVLQTPLRHAGK